MKLKNYKIFLGLTRISLGLILFWAFVDKVYGLGFATEAGKAWVDGVSPTLGFLSFATKGPFSNMHQALAGQLWVDVLFMAGLCLIGLSLILGIGIKVAGYTGALLMFLLYSAVLPPEHHPFLDEHILYALVLLSFTQMPVGQWLGLGKWWSRQALVKKFPWME